MEGELMTPSDYLNWVSKNTITSWWHDSADPLELAFGIKHGAIGVTTNPVICYRSLNANAELWRVEIEKVLRGTENNESQAEALMKIVLNYIAAIMKEQYDISDGESGYVCAQVNPGRAGNRDIMLEMARHFHSWKPNIAVKLPVTAAGLDVLEECAAEGITITATVSFTVPQVLQIAERYRKGLERAKKNSVKPGKCFAVIMIGRLDDYIRDVALDSRAEINESDIVQAGLAITKRAYEIYKREKYEAKLLVAALRGPYHMSELVGADLIMSIAPKYQKLLLAEGMLREERIDFKISEKVISRLSNIPEFVKSYEPDGMKPEDFITFGASQRTLTQFYEIGWNELQGFRL
ncbi:MAG: transaldolase family protein [Spirochaetaceae bacterium]|nr:MAG: transaldolase family protein [Spirochaetaceae bacterium]